MAAAEPAMTSATARRIEQSVSDLGRQISWVTRASADTVDKHRADFAQLLHQVPSVSQLSWLSGSGQEQLRLTRSAISVNSGEDFSRDVRFVEGVRRGINLTSAYFRDGRPYMSIALAHSGVNAGVTVAEIDLHFLSDFLGDAEVGKVAAAYVVDKRGQVLASSAKGPEVAKDVSALPQVAALIKPDGQAQASGTDTSGQAVLTAPAPHASLGQPGVLRAVVGGGFYLTILAMLAMGLAAIIRHTAGAISAFVTILLIVPLILQALPSSVVNTVGRYVPANIGATVTSTSGVAGGATAVC